jgi:hypothetical protein
MKRTAMQHTKLKRLVRVLQIPQYAAVGILESLWHLTAREALMGNIGKLTNEDIAAWIDWEGDADSLVAALVSSGWIDEDSTHRLVIHDWLEHADDTTKKAISRHSPEIGGNVQTPPDKPPLPKPLPKPEPVPKPDAKATTGADAPFVIPEWIESKVWNGYEEMRKKIRKPMTDNARDLCVKKLASLKRAGHDPTDVLNEAILNSWQGIFAPKGERTNGNTRISNTDLIENRRGFLESRRAGRMADGIDHSGGHGEAGVAGDGPGRPGPTLDAVLAHT